MIAESPMLVNRLRAIFSGKCDFVFKAPKNPKKGLTNCARFSIIHRQIKKRRSAYTEKYSRGRRGAPAKGVGRDKRRESSNLSFSANEKRTFVYQMKVRFFIFIALFRAKTKQKQEQLGVAALKRTVAALFLCPQKRQIELYFLSFFARIKNSKNIAP